MNKEKYYRDFLMALTGDHEFSSGLAEEMHESDTDPERFAVKHADNFSFRGITGAHKDQTLFYMIDVLEESSYAFELDWAADLAELNEAIKILSRGRVDTPVVDDQRMKGVTSMSALLEIADDILEEKGWAILYFPSETDQFPIGLVPSDKWEEIDAMIDELF